MAAIAVTVQCAHTFGARMRGLLGRPPPAPGEALWLRPCNQVHTLFMRYAIDVVYLDLEHRVLAVKTLPPWRVGSRLWSAHSVLELAEGEAARLGLAPGERATLITR